MFSSSFPAQFPSALNSSSALQPLTPPDRLLRAAAKSGNAEEVKRIIALHPSAVRIGDFHGVTALHHACYRGHLPVVQLLCEVLREQISMPNKEGLPPLYFAVRMGHLDVVQYLVARGAFKDEPFTGKDWSKTHMYVAAQEGHLPLVKYLADDLALNVNDTRTHGRTPLFIACKRNHLDVVRYLLSRPGGRQADPNIPAENYRTPLHVSCNEGHLQICQILLVYGAKADALDSYLHQPIYYASKQHRVAIEEHWALARNWTSLQLAVDARFLPEVDAWLRRGSQFSPHISRNSPQHPLVLATTTRAYHNAPPVCPLVAKAIKGGFGPWSPAFHHYFPPVFTTALLRLFLIVERLAMSGHHSVYALVPHEIIYMIMGNYFREDLSVIL